MAKQSANSSQMENLGDKGARMRKECIDIVDGDVALVFVDGHDDAILGVAERDGEFVVVYDQAKIIRRLRKHDGMDKDGASEFFEYNIASAMFDSNAPLFVYRA